MVPARDAERLEIILSVIDDIDRRLLDETYERFLTDRDEQDLTAYPLAVIGENAGRLSDEIRARYPQLPWKGMISLRNVVSHAYDRIDPEDVWRAAIQGLEPIRAMCRREQARLAAEMANPPDPNSAS